jgi:hypothetical protein
MAGQNKRIIGLIAAALTLFAFPSKAFADEELNWVIEPQFKYAIILTLTDTL